MQPKDARLLLSGMGHYVTLWVYQHSGRFFSVTLHMRMDVSDKVLALTTTHDVKRHKHILYIMTAALTSKFIQNSPGQIHMFRFAMMYFRMGYCFRWSPSPPLFH
jgi:hypothetical protein